MSSKRSSLTLDENIFLDCVETSISKDNNETDLETPPKTPNFKKDEIKPGLVNLANKKNKNLYQNHIKNIFKLKKIFKIE